MSVNLHPYAEVRSLTLNGKPVKGMELCCPAKQFREFELPLMGRDAQPGALVIGRHYITARDSAPVRYNDIV